MGQTSVRVFRKCPQLPFSFRPPAGASAGLTSVSILLSVQCMYSTIITLRLSLATQSTHNRAQFTQVPRSGRPLLVWICEPLSSFRFTSRRRGSVQPIQRTCVSLAPQTARHVPSKGWKLALAAWALKRRSHSRLRCQPTAYSVAASDERAGGRAAGARFQHESGGRGGWRVERSPRPTCATAPHHHLSYPSQDGRADGWTTTECRPAAYSSKPVHGTATFGKCPSLAE